MLMNLKKLREEAGVSQKALAEAIGVSQQSVNKYENHNIEPDIGTLIRIADYFDTSVDYLIGRSIDRHSTAPITSFALNQDEAAVIRKYKSLSPPQKKAVKAILESY